ncbi:sperm acrosome-associated protein 9-like [Saccoglossus kowalevskii]|uniref:Chromosome 9 open reading frame 9 protein-like n=1 Tax=Saccoglossus kowalevskii TaxID=10224 RepID=A0A0U2K756_SACKO|nr:PREDICTED: uncharacterized protein C9orf9-like [Saccoglossus kowalevskii]ALR88603.1 chromosome 9 open reading frame 9 protein-like [Saccoglossus kowalevskii]
MNLSELRRETANFQARYRVLQQQQFTFVYALDNCRTDSYERTRPVRCIATVKEYMQRSHNATDKRAMRQWLDFLQDLDAFRRKLDAEGEMNGPLGQAMDKWKMLLNPSNDMSSLRVKYPHQEVNHLSCDEARNYYGGAVSLIPTILDVLGVVQSQVAMCCANGTWPPIKDKSFRASSAMNRRSQMEGELLGRSQSSMDKSVDTRDLRKSMGDMATKCKPKRYGGPKYDLGDTAFYRRTLNGRVDEIKLKPVKKVPWRGASKDNINHVEHRRFRDIKDRE